MPNNKSDYYTYSHDDPNVNTIGKFVSGPSSIGSGLDIVKLLSYTDEKGLRNLDSLTSLYTYDELLEFGLLINQLVATNSKSTADKTTTVPSSVGGKTTTTDVVSSVQPKPLITAKTTTIYQLNKTIADLDGILYVDNKTNPHYLNQQKPYLDQLFDDRVKKLFTKFCFLVKNRTDYEVYITSSFRPLSKKESKYSDHYGRLAIDINLMLQSTGVITVKQPKSGIHRDASGNWSHTQFNDVERKAFELIWRQTGVIEIAEELGLVWGGGFKSTYFDPVHFEATYYYHRNINEFNEALKQQTTTTESAVLPVDSEVSQNSVYSDLPIHVGTILNLPLKDLDRDVLITETNQTVNTTDFESFLARELYFLLSEKQYQREFIPNKKVSISQVKEIFPFISVWVWSRALSIYSDGQYAHKILNVTPYISALTTTVGDNGGSFSVELSSIEGEVLNDHWRIAQHTQKASNINSGDYVSHNFLHYEKDGELKRSNFFFEKALQQNDVVFIKFERLILETDRKNLDDLETISVNQLPNQIFDMIGLIDSPSINTQPASAAVSINITGRDLVKTIIEDGVYFYPIRFTDGGIFANETGSANHRLQRYDGQIDTNFQHRERTIDRSLKYIMNALSSIEICPTDLFAGYANGIDRITGNQVDKRTVAYQLDDETRSTIQDHQREIDKKKSEVISKIGSIRKSRQIEEGSSTSVFNTIESFLSARIINNEVVEKLSSILSWSQIIDGKTIKNQLPTSLLDSLFLRNRSWVSNTSDNIKPNDFQSRDVIQDVEDLFKRVRREDVKKFKPEIFSQLLRVDQSLPNIKPVITEVYSLKDLINEVKSNISDSNVIDGVSYDSTGFSKALSQSTSLKHTAISDDLTVIEDKYKLVVGLGKSISLQIVNKFFTDLTNEEKSIFNDIYNIVKEENSVLKQQQASPQLLPVKGIWQIIKLVVDDSVKNRLVVDPSIGNELGSLINAIRKICQDPFCEFFTDTYGDQFYFIVRKKPFDRESIKSFIDGRTVFEKIVPQAQPIPTSQSVLDLRPTPTPFVDFKPVDVKQDIVISIDESDLLSDSLSYSMEAYSWYRIQLNNVMSGSDSDMSFAYLKAIYFNEYADVFGSKPLDVTTNYIPYQPVIDKNQKLPTAYFIRQGTYDLKYLIESHAYLPFTRQGTIVINGDRRIKRGTFIRLKATNEIFYVDSVSHSFSIDQGSIDRTTTLHVSRGMVEKYINGVTIQTQTEAVNISYFNICNLPIDESVFTSSQEGYSDFNRLVLSKWKVNPTVFNFFLRKLQFIKNISEINTNE